MNSDDDKFSPCLTPTLHTRVYDVCWFSMTRTRPDVVIHVSDYIKYFYVHLFLHQLVPQTFTPHHIKSFLVVHKQTKTIPSPVKQVNYTFKQKYMIQCRVPMPKTCLFLIDNEISSGVFIESLVKYWSKQLPYTPNKVIPW